MTKHTLKNIWIRRNLAYGIFLTTVLFSALIISLIPSKYTATSIVKIVKISSEIKNIEDIISDQDYIKTIKAEEIKLIRSPKFINKIIKLLKLDQNPEFNIKLDTNRAVTTKIIDDLYKNKESQQPLKDKIFNDINKNLHINFTTYNIYINYASSMPYLSKAISDKIAQKYVQINNTNISKTILKKSNLPIYPSNINFINYIITIIMLGLFFGIIGTIYIKPKYPT